MIYTNKGYFNNIKPRAKQAVVLAFMLCFIAVAFLSKEFVLAHANHEHDKRGIGGSCLACAQMQNAENLLRHIGAAFIGAYCSVACFLAAISLIRSYSSNAAMPTLITLKIKMNN